jgi:hypothetical protein
MARPRKIHIASQCYARNFATGEQVMVHDKRTGQTALRNVEKVARRYRWWGPDGTLSTAAEETLGPCESAAALVLGRLVECWPLDRADRATLAQFLAIHTVRGPAWREDFVRISMAAIRDELGRQRWEPELERDAVQEFMGDRMRVEALLKQIPRMASLFASMHWSLVVFDSEWIATCDQPVVCVPLLRAQQIGTIEAIPRAGFLNTAEVRIPLDPAHVLLLTWLDEPDGQRIAGQLRHAADVNRSTYEQADRQWFHRPATYAPRIAPPVWDPACYPISYELLPPYSADMAFRARRRGEASRVVQELIDSQAADVLRWVTVSHRDEAAAVAGSAAG